MRGGLVVRAFSPEPGGPGSNPTVAENFISHFSVVCLTRPGLGERLTIRLSQIITVNVSEDKKQLPYSYTNIFT